MHKQFQFCLSLQEENTYCFIRNFRQVLYFVDCISNVLTAVQKISIFYMNFSICKHKFNGRSVSRPNALIKIYQIFKYLRACYVLMYISQEHTYLTKQVRGKYSEQIFRQNENFLFFFVVCQDTNLSKEQRFYPKWKNIPTWWCYLQNNLEAFVFIDKGKKERFLGDCN